MHCEQAQFGPHIGLEIVVAVEMVRRNVEQHRHIAIEAVGQIDLIGTELEHVDAAFRQRLLAEDPTSPESLEFAALVDALAGRVDGAARKLSDLVFYSPDRAAGYAVAGEPHVVRAERRSHAYPGQTTSGPA